ncbi:MAG: 30S ribosomal protein S20 [Acidobacteria bacterium]|nr:30S ribosomal protein S20 [Acidobacteriota bacterium]
MPNIASAKKRMRQSVVRRDRNRGSRSALRTSLRKLDEAIEAGDMDRIRESWTAAQSLLDRTAQRGVIHRNQAARKKARLSRRISKLESS